MQKTTQFSAKITLLAILAISLAGCNSKNKEQKFTDEQLRTLPAPQRSDLPAPTGGLVLSVNGELITADEIINPSVKMLGDTAKQNDFEKFAGIAAPHIYKLLTDKITTTLLYQKAKAKVPETVLEEGGPLDKAVDKEIRKFVMMHNGNYARAQEEIEKMGFDWESFRDYQKKMLLTQSYFASELGKSKPITHTDILLTYNELKDDYFKVDGGTKFQLIDIRPSVIAQEEKLSIEEADIRAKDIADAISSMAQNGYDFTELVKKHSNGIKADQDGIWETSGPGSLAKPYDIIEESLSQVTPGQTTAPIRCEDHIFIAKLIKNQKAGYLPLEQVHSKIEEYIKNKERKQQFDVLLTKMLKDARISGIEGFLDYCLRQTYIRGTSKI